MSKLKKTREDFRLMAIGHYLSDSEELTLAEQLEALDKADPYELVENVPGVLVWHIFEGREVGELIDIMEMLADDLEKMYNEGREFQYSLQP